MGKLDGGREKCIRDGIRGNRKMKERKSRRRT